MLTDANFQELLDFHSTNPVLSVYLNTDLAQRSSDAYKLELRQLIKSSELLEDNNGVGNFVEHSYDGSGRSLMLFSCAPEKFFRSYQLNVPIKSRLRISNNPHLKPLMDVLDFYGGYGVALVDRQGARLFAFHLGELLAQEGMMGSEVHHTKRGGASTMPGRQGGIAGRTNHEEMVIERNMKEIAEFSIHFFAKHKVRRVILGGTDDNLTNFRNHLPKTWQSLIIGSLPMQMTASANEIMASAMEIGQQAEQAHEQKLVNQAISGATRQHGGVVQLDSTLKAVHDGRVQTLLVREGFRAPGYQCQGCSYITAKALTTCPFCGKGFNQIKDAVEMAVRSVLQKGGEVEILQSVLEDEKLGGIGAILRY
jgi:peptide subunit release factor 1 (eRF1)